MTEPPSVILLDIETSPLIGLSWGVYDTNILKVLEPSKIISVAWKRLGEKDIHCKALSDYDNYEKGILNDEFLVKETWNVLDKADVVIAHHGDSFDIKKLNTRFIYYELNAPSFYETIDTLKIAKKYFKFESNSLNELGKYLDEGIKAHSNLNLWLKCMDGDQASWDQMKLYNSRDVELLERVYLRLRPYCDDHPNLNIINNTDNCCPTCLSTNIEKRGFSVTRAGRKQRYACQDCGSWSSGPSISVRDVVR